MNFSPGFHLKLKSLSKIEQKPMAQIVEEKLTAVLAAEQETSLQRMYAGLFALEGMCTEPIRDASTTIDEVLYGAGAVEKGRHE